MLLEIYCLSLIPQASYLLSAFHHVAPMLKYETCSPEMTLLLMYISNVHAMIMLFSA